MKVLEWNPVKAHETEYKSPSPLHVMRSLLAQFHRAETEGGPVSMTPEIEDLHFKHTLKSGKTIRLSVHRKANTRPVVIGDWVKTINSEDLLEYATWRESIVATMIAKLTPGEIERCARDGREKSKGGPR